MCSQVGWRSALYQGPDLVFCLISTPQILEAASRNTLQRKGGIGLLLDQYSERIAWARTGSGPWLQLKRFARGVGGVAVGCGGEPEREDGARRRPEKAPTIMNVVIEAAVKSNAAALASTSSLAGPGRCRSGRGSGPNQITPVSSRFWVQGSGAASTAGLARLQRRDRRGRGNVDDQSERAEEKASAGSGTGEGEVVR